MNTLNSYYSMDGYPTVPQEERFISGSGLDRNTLKKLIDLKCGRMHYGKIIKGGNQRDVFEINDNTITALHRAGKVDAIFENDQPTSFTWKDGLAQLGEARQAQAIFAVFGVSPSVSSQGDDTSLATQIQETAGNVIDLKRPVDDLVNEARKQALRLI